MHENTYMAPNNLCGFIPLSAFWLAPDQQRLADVCCFRHVHKAITLAQGRRKAKGGDTCKKIQHAIKNFQAGLNSSPADESRETSLLVITQSEGIALSLSESGHHNRRLNLCWEDSSLYVGAFPELSLNLC